METPIDTTSLCEGGGIPAESDYLFFHRSGGFDANPAYLDQYCGGGAQDLINYIHTIITSCPNDHSQMIEDDYYDERLYKIKYCSADAVTGKNCGEVINEGYGYFHEPYSQWDPNKCSSSCIAELDEVYRDKYKNRKPEECSSSIFNTGCMLFTMSENPLNLCGTEYVPREEEDGTIDDTNNSNEDESSGATTLSSHVALLSLIMCIIFAFLK